MKMIELSSEDRARLDEIRSHYPDSRAAAVSVMKWLQSREGHISDDSLRLAADYLGLPSADLEELATFYNLLFRRPVGRRVIKVCDSISCWMCGGDTVREHLRARLGIGLGETTPDGEFTLLPTVCLGDCDHAPALMVNDELYGDLTRNEIDRIIDAPAGGGDAREGRDRG